MMVRGVNLLPVFSRVKIQGLNRNLDPLVEKKTTGHGGRRRGAELPRGTTTGPRERIYLPLPMAEWMKNSENQSRVEKLMQKRC